LFYGPSAPFAVHDRGSQGSRAWTAGFGGLKSGTVVVVVVVGGTVVVVLVVVVVVVAEPWCFLGWGCVVVVEVGGGAGGFTLKSVPVMTVT
jgi:hypothetical protein